MLKIRVEQMEVLRQYMVRQFEERMRIHLRQVFPHELKTVAETELREHIRFGVEKAMSYQVMREGDVQRYLECAVVYGWKFDLMPWAKEILQKEDWSGEMKMDKIEQYGLMER